MKDLNYELYDIVEMKKPHPCASHSKLFQIIRLGADLKIQCQGCGNIILIPRDTFNTKFKKVVEHKDNISFTSK